MTSVSHSTIWLRRAGLLSQTPFNPRSITTSSRRLQDRPTAPGSSSSTATRTTTEGGSSSSTNADRTVEAPYNEAEEYLRRKAARKAERSSNPNPNSARARHVSLYTDILPALLRVFAYGSTAYFGLHLIWNVLDRDEQRKLMADQTSSLQDQIRGVTNKVSAAKGDHDDGDKNNRHTEQLDAKANQLTRDAQSKTKSWWPFGGSSK